MTVLDRTDGVRRRLGCPDHQRPRRLRRRRSPTRSGRPRSGELADLRNATLLAHNYQLPAIQDVADHVGDSLALSRIAAEAPEDTIVFCGVHFMAETAKILSPDKTVLIPDQRAGCSLADSITADDLRAWKDEFPDAVVVSYVNTTAAVKALTDICCTSSNAVEVVASIPEDREVLFCPDQFLGAHVRRVTGRKNLHVWAGECHVHAGINGDELAAQASAHPDAELFVHPECGCATSALYLAGEGAFPDDRVKILSTGGMLDAARQTRARQVLVATEVGMLHQLRRAAPEVDFRAVNDRASCKYMKMITPAALLRCLVEGADEVHVDAETAAPGSAQRAADDRDRPARRRGMNRPVLRRARLLAAAGRRRRHRHRRGRPGRRAGRAPPRRAGRRAQQGAPNGGGDRDVLRPGRHRRRGAATPTTPSRRTSRTRWPRAAGCATRRGDVDRRRRIRRGGRTGRPTERVSTSRRRASGR